MTSPQQEQGPDPNQQLEAIIEEYVMLVRAELGERWTKWSTTLSDLEAHECIGGLLARQVTIATQLARSPSIWNAHIAPILLRSMVDTHINLAWILIDLVPRARQYILHGLGQYKLHLEHLRAAADRFGYDIARELQAMEEWQQSQRFGFLTEVNVGHWAEVTTRQMAQECDELDLYNLAYVPFSAATHSMWNHVARLNLYACESPLHRHHRIPADVDLAPEPDYLYRAAKYAHRSFVRFDKATRIEPEAPSAFGQLSSRFEALFGQAPPPDPELP